jgi:hypothetical protein
LRQDVGVVASLPASAPASGVAPSAPPVSALDASAPASPAAASPPASVVVVSPLASVVVSAPLSVVASPRVSVPASVDPLLLEQAAMPAPATRKMTM